MNERYIGGNALFQIYRIDLADSVRCTASPAFCQDFRIAGQCDAKKSPVIPNHRRRPGGYCEDSEQQSLAPGGSCLISKNRSYFLLSFVVIFHSDP